MDGEVEQINMESFSQCDGCALKVCQLLGSNTSLISWLGHFAQPSKILQETKSPQFYLDLGYSPL